MKPLTEAMIVFFGWFILFTIPYGLIFVNDFFSCFAGIFVNVGFLLWYHKRYFTSSK